MPVPAGAPVPVTNKKGQLPKKRGDEKPTGLRAKLKEMAEVGGFNIWLREQIKETPSWVVSTVIHALLLIVLAIWAIIPPSEDFITVSSVNNDEIKEDELNELEDSPLSEELEQTELFSEIDTPIEEPEVSDFMDEAAPPVHVELSEASELNAALNDMMKTIGSTSGTGFDGRGRRAGMASAGGGSAGSEAAVGRALKWLSLHQNSDGSWKFDHTQCGTCQEGFCTYPGMETSVTGATALGLLPFLGAGETPRDGQYRTNVYKALEYLRRAQKADGDLRGTGEHGM